MLSCIQSLHQSSCEAMSCGNRHPAEIDMRSLARHDDAPAKMEGTTMMMCQFSHNGETSHQSTTDLCANIGMLTRDVLHIHLIEDVAEQLHAMIVIDSHELVILLLCDVARWLLR